MMFPQRLLTGYGAFAYGRLPTEQHRYQELAESGQQPEIMVIGCCDSRVSPEVIFDAGPGELFVVRNVANLVPPYAPDGRAHGVSAALEYAVAALKVKHIVVLGHAHCGGIRAHTENPEPRSDSDFIGQWMALIGPAAAKISRHGLTPEQYLERIEKAAIAQSLYNLMTFPRIARQVESGAVQTHGAYFGVATGALSVLDKETGEFRKV